MNATLEGIANVAKFVAKYATALVKEASTKLTTYLALVPAGLSELLSNWDQAASVFPHWLIEQKPHLISISALLVIWGRVRRLLPGSGAPVPPSGQGQP